MRHEYDLSRQHCMRVLCDNDAFKWCHMCKTIYRSLDIYTYIYISRIHMHVYITFIITECFQCTTCVLLNTYVQNQ